MKQSNIEESSICTLKIRDERGEAYILHLATHDRVKDIYSWMERVIKGKFRVMGNFPRRSYLADEAENLAELGFCPNGMLHIQSRAEA